MLESTFQLVRGMGPGKERALWRRGIVHWSELPKRHDDLLHSAVAEAAAALRRRDVDHLAALLPSGEHWRLFPQFGDDAAYVDIETSDDVVGFEGISAIGVLDRNGPRLFLAGRDLHHFPAAARGWSMLVTFNGRSFDLPILRRAFPAWRPPLAHADLRHALRRLGQTGGLKAIERRLRDLHLTRPDHLAGLDGKDTGWLFRRGREGDLSALRRFAEYNLYDAVNLRTLMAYAYNELVAEECSCAPLLHNQVARVAVPGRGDVLYDVSKILMSLQSRHATNEWAITDQTD
jgi:uncharacterized protein